MLGKIDAEVVEKFKIFQEQSGEYEGLDIETVLFEKVVLEELIDIFDSQRQPLSKIERNVKQGDYPYYGASGIIDYLDEYKFNGDYLIISEDGENLRARKTPIAFWATGKFWVNNHAHILLGKEDILFTEYLRVFISSDKLQGFISNSSQPKLTQSNLKLIPIPIPKSQENYTSYQIQEAIVTFLEFWKVEYTDVYRTKIKEMTPFIKTMQEQLISATFRLDRRLKESFNEFAIEKDFDIKIEEIEFESVSLANKSFFNLTMGQSPESKYFNKNADGVPFYQGKTDFGKMYLNSPTNWTTKSKKEAIKDDILITLRAPAGVINIASENISIGRGLASIRCKKTVSLLYAYRFLKVYENKIDTDNNNGGFFSSMNKDYLESFQFMIPTHPNYNSIELQKLLVEFWEMILDNLDERLKLFERVKELCDEIDEAFLYKTFSKIEWGKR